MLIIIIFKNYIYMLICFNSSQYRYEIDEIKIIYYTLIKRNFLF